jgi:hypothetical protein
MAGGVMRLLVALIAMFFFIVCVGVANRIGGTIVLTEDIELLLPKAGISMLLGSLGLCALWIAVVYFIKWFQESPESAEEDWEYIEEEI